jgi:hypothetical protein
LTVTYHFDKRANTWGILGPEAEVHLGEVAVTTKSGAVKTETVTRIGGGFERDGVKHVFADIAPRDQAATSQPAPTTMAPAAAAPDKIRAAIIVLDELAAALRELLASPQTPTPAPQPALPPPRQHREQPSIQTPDDVPF